VLVAVALGGVLGAEARYGLGQLVPERRAQFPWATFIVNVSGCLLIGCLMAVILGLTAPHRLARPFLGVGILGGYTTFSTCVIDAERLVTEHHLVLALGYVASTLAACLAAVAVATIATQRAGRAVRHAGLRRRMKGTSP
jgi:CrcB protein